jgi:hypothetical protein
MICCVFSAVNHIHTCPVVPEVVLLLLLLQVGQLG